MGKVFLYILILPIVIWAIECLKLDHIFKSGRVFKIRVFYILISFALTYLVVNCLYDFSTFFQSSF